MFPLLTYLSLHLINDFLFNGGYIIIDITVSKKII